VPAAQHCHVSWQCLRLLAGFRKSAEFSGHAGIHYGYRQWSGRHSRLMGMQKQGRRRGKNPVAQVKEPIGVQRVANPVHICSKQAPWDITQRCRRRDREWQSHAGRLHMPFRRREQLPRQQNRAECVGQAYLLR